MADAGKRAVVAALLADLQADDAPTRWRAALSLANRHTPEAVQALGRALQDPEPFVRWNAAQALSEQARRSSDRTVPLLVGRVVLEAAAAPDADVRAAAADTVAAWGNRAPLEPLLSLAQDSDPRVRAAAVRALGLSGSAAPQVAGPALQRALTDSDPEVRRMAASAIAWCRYEPALPELRACLEDPFGTVRAAALRALARVGNGAHESTVISLLQDSDIGVRAEAVRFLRLRGGEQALTVLARFEADATPVAGCTLGDLVIEARLHIARRLGLWRELRFRWRERRGAS